MNAIQKTIGGLLLCGAICLCGCAPMPAQFPELPLSMVEPYFIGAAEVEAIDTAFYQVKDANGALIGTVLFSMPFTESVKGYNGTTPLLIALDAEDHITNVTLLPNHETPRFAERVAAAGLYEVWNGLSVDEAIEKPVDAISGATYTSTGVKNTLKARLETYQRQLTKDRNLKNNFWHRLFSK